MSTHTRFEQQDLTTLGQKITLFFSHHPSLVLSWGLLVILFLLPLGQKSEKSFEIESRSIWKKNVQTQLGKRFGDEEVRSLFSSLLMGTPLPPS